MSSRLLKKYEKIPGGFRIEITGIQYYCSTALESAVRTADTSAMEVYWDPDGYSSPSRLWFSRICAAMESMAGAIRGYIVSTESLKGTRDTERISVRSTVTSTLTFSLPKTMGDE